MSELEFQECLKKINSGDKNSLKKIYYGYGYAVYAYALSIVKDTHMAEDICQDVFIKIWKNANKFKKRYNPQSWIMTITKNTSIDYLRKHKKEETIERFEIDVEKDMATEVNQKLQINEALNTLQEEEKEIIILHLISDLTFRAISELLNKPLGTITWRYKEGIKKLKDSIIL